MATVFILGRCREWLRQRPQRLPCQRRLKSDPAGSWLGWMPGPFQAAFFPFGETWLARILLRSR